MHNITKRFAVFLAGLLTLALSFTIVSCTSQKDDNPSGKPVVLTTFTILADMAKNVAGDHLTIESITKPGSEIHDFDPSPGDIRHATTAGLILDNGFGLERWFEKFVGSSKAPHVTLTEGIKPIDIANGPYGGQPNPHAWMSPKSALIYVDNIVAALSDYDKDHTEEFKANGEDYKKKIQEVSVDLQKTLDKLPPEHRSLVTCEGAFSYLARDYEMKELFLWPVNADNEGTPDQIKSVVDSVRKDKIPAVFCESTVNDSSMKQVAKETGAIFGGALYVDSLSTADGDAPTYLELLRYDATLISKGLSGKGDK